MDTKTANSENTVHMTGCHNIIFFIVAIMMMVCTFVCMPMTADAADIMVRFGSNYYDKNQGDTFPMGVYVQNDDKTVTGIGSYTVQISYDVSRLKFTGADAGAATVTDSGNGTLTMTGTSNGVDNKTMLHFEAIAGGAASVTVYSATVYGTDGTTELTVSTLGSVPVNITGTEPAAAVQDGNQDAAAKNDTKTDTVQDTDKTDTDNADKTDTDNADKTDTDNADTDKTGTDDTDTGKTDKTDAESSDTESVDKEDSGETDADKADSEDDKTSDVEIPVTANTEADGVANEVNETLSTGTGGTAATKFASSTTDSELRMVVIIIIAVMAIAILTLIIILVVRFISSRRSRKVYNNDNSESNNWAFEFDTIDEDHDGEVISQDEIPSQFVENESGFTEDEPDFEFDDKQ